MPCQDFSGKNASVFFEKNIKKYARPLPRVYAIFLFAIEYSAKAQHTTTGARAGGGVRHTGGARPCCYVLSLG